MKVDCLFCIGVDSCHMPLPPILYGIRYELANLFVFGLSHRKRLVCVNRTRFSFDTNAVALDLEADTQLKYAIFAHLGKAFCATFAHFVSQKRATNRNPLSSVRLNGLLAVKALAVVVQLVTREPFTAKPTLIKDIVPFAVLYFGTAVFLSKCSRFIKIVKVKRLIFFINHISTHRLKPPSLRVNHLQQQFTNVLGGLALPEKFIPPIVEASDDKPALKAVENDVIVLFSHTKNLPYTAMV